MPVIDVFSGRCKGNLRVVLAMGRWEQIISLQRTRDEECDSIPHLTRPVHLLDHLPHAETKVSIHFGDISLKIINRHLQMYTRTIQNCVCLEFGNNECSVSGYVPAGDYSS